MLENIITEAKKLVNTKILTALKTEGASVAFSKLYVLLPGAIRLFIKEETFIKFCVEHKEKIFGAEIKKQTVKKASTKKIPAKKKLATKKTTVKKKK
jgi:hypothetical protein